MLKTRSCSLAWLALRADWVGLGCPPASFHGSHCTPLLLNMQMCKSANQTIHYIMLHSFGRHSHPGQLKMLVGAERIIMKGIWIGKDCLSVDLSTRDMTQNYEQLILTSLWESLTHVPRKVFYYLGARQKSSSSLKFFFFLFLLFSRPHWLLLYGQNQFKRVPYMFQRRKSDSFGTTWDNTFFPLIFWVNYPFNISCSVKIYVEVWITMELEIVTLL